jgi:GNAT superfamily N-acetyltransferase
METAFDIGLQAYSVHRLLLEDKSEVQKLLEKCSDYMLLVEGRPAGPNSGEEEFQEVPPGRSPNEKLMFGIFNQQNELIGLLDALPRYPDETTWWIGLFLLVPESRSEGIGQRTILSFIEYVRANKGQAIMLGAVEENKLACKFWSRMGFEFVRKTEPRQFGKKTQSVIVMRQILLCQEG